MTPEVPGSPRIPTHRELFLVLLHVTVISFGTALPFIRRAVIEQQRWMTEREFNEAFSIAQILPGGNVVNLAIILGTRFHGATGALVAFLGILLPPLAVAIAAAMLYQRYGSVALVHAALGGMAAAGVGLLFATVLKMARPYRDNPLDIALIALAFAGIVVLHLPLFWVLSGLVVLGIAARAWLVRRSA